MCVIVHVSVCKGVCKYRQARTPLRRARTRLRWASDKSQIDILKTILTDFFCRFEWRICNLNIICFQKLEKFENKKFIKVLKF